MAGLFVPVPHQTRCLVVIGWYRHLLRRHPPAGRAIRRDFAEDMNRLGFQPASNRNLFTLGDIGFVKIELDGWRSIGGIKALDLEVLEGAATHAAGDPWT
jgi:hypothetical protein